MSFADFVTTLAIVLSTLAMAGLYATHRGRKGSA